MGKTLVLTLGVLYLWIQNILAEIVDFPGNSDRVTHLPGVDKDTLNKQKIFSGYLSIGSTKHVYYYFVESKKNMQSDPLAIYFTGGPSQSALIHAFGGDGPFSVQLDQTVKENPYSFNNNANVLYFDAPVGTGYSYQETGDYFSSDSISIEENLQTLVTFMEKFPHMKNHELILYGESYGGGFSSLLAQRLIQWNKNNIDDPFNVKKVFATSSINKYHNLTNYQVYKHHSKTFFKDYEISLDVENCSIFDENGIWKKKTISEMGEDCPQLDTQFWEHFGQYLLDKNIDLYNVNRTCYNNWTALVEHATHLQNELSRGEGIYQPPVYPTELTCHANFGLFNYLNLDEVKTTLHASSHVNWAYNRIAVHFASQFKDYFSIAEKLLFNYHMFGFEKYDSLWRELADNGIQIVLIYGEYDMMCSYYSGQMTVDSTDLPLVEEKKEWSYSGDATHLPVTGQITKYRNLDFIMARGEGHYLNIENPRLAYYLFYKYALGLEIKN